ncbi:hypothetical protein Tco_0387037 [Tanacetum coccineum]
MFSTRGLRQDDLLSLFLFLLVAEALQISILEACSKGVFKCIHLTNSGASLSLLQYADDALFFAHVKVINTLEAIRCRFFWGFKDSQHGICWVKWKSIPHEQNKGGLRVGSILVKNISLLGKWKRRYLSEPNALWRIVIKDLYGNDGGFGSNPTPSGCGGVLM